MADNNQQDNEQAVAQWLPSFYKLAQGYWRGLPPSVRDFYSVEDMVQDVALSVILAIPRFEASRGVRIGTYVYCVAANSCRNILTYYDAQKRYPGVVVPIEDWVCGQDSTELSADELVETQDLVDRIIGLASEGAVCVLTDPACRVISLASEGVVRALTDPAWVFRSPKRVAEYVGALRMLAKHVGADRRTFARAMAMLAS